MENGRLLHELFSVLLEKFGMCSCFAYRLSLLSPQRPVDLVSVSSVCPARSLGLMSAKAAINKEVFVPHDEKMLAAVTVKRRTKKKIPFLATGGQGDYMTFICLSG